MSKSRYIYMNHGSTPPPPPPLFTHFRFKVSEGSSGIPFAFADPQVAMNGNLGNLVSCSYNTTWGTNAGYHQILTQWYFVTDGLHNCTGLDTEPDIGEELLSAEFHVDESGDCGAGDTGISMGNGPSTDAIDVVWEPCFQDGTRDDD